MKALFCFGTRPETIKMAPLIKEWEKKGNTAIVCITGQHKEMLDPFLKFFNIKADFNLEIMEKGQGLEEITSKILLGIKGILKKEGPDYLFVQGDTSSTFSCALAAFYQKIKVVHIEAGLRTGDVYSPFPEEMNRKMVSQLASYHFCPTEMAKQNLINEGFKNNVFVTGNTGIDGLRVGLELIEEETLLKEFNNIDFNKKVILLTSHRRENHGQPLVDICEAIITLIKKFPDIEVVYPVHLNPNVREVVFKKLGNVDRVHLIDPLEYPKFIWLMKKSSILLTDSGGVQEEGPFLKKPVLVLRENTERQEGILSQTAVLVGNKKDKIIKIVSDHLENKDLYSSYQNKVNPFGDGYSSEKIISYFNN